MEKDTKYFFKFLRGLIVKHYEDTNHDSITLDQYWKNKVTENNLSEALNYFEALEKELDYLRFELVKSRSKRVTLESGRRVLYNRIEALTTRVKELTDKRR